ncbi:hypothetical protein [Streptomyces sp. NPDC054834]
MQTVILNNGVDMPLLGFGVHRAASACPQAERPRSSRGRPGGFRTAQRRVRRQMQTFLAEREIEFGP